MLEKERGSRGEKKAKEGQTGNKKEEILPIV